MMNRSYASVSSCGGGSDIDCSYRYLSRFGDVGSFFPCSGDFPFNSFIPVRRTIFADFVFSPHSPDGKLLVSTSLERTKLWDLEMRRESLIFGKKSSD